MLKTFSNHIASIRCICKAKIKSLDGYPGVGSENVSSYVLVSAGSRYEANVYVVSVKKDATGGAATPSFKVAHLSHFIKATDEQKRAQDEQDLRIMACVAFEAPDNRGVFFGFGSSAGLVEWYTLSKSKKRLVRKDENP